MAAKVAINGFGRIGRNVFKIINDSDIDAEVVHINDLTDAKQLAHLLKYDSVHGKYDAEIEAKDSAIVVDGKEIEVSAVKDPSELPWEEKEIDVVVEATGIFKKPEQMQMHLDAGAKKVLLTVPAKGDIDATIVLGVNDDILEDDMQMVSNASCTTNCLAPIAKVLNDEFGIKSGLMTTIHAYTSSQNILDGPHKKDYRRARACAANIVPTTTGAAKAVGKVIPELDGKLNGMAMRVPVPDGSVVDLTVELEKDATVDDINAAMKKASEGPMKGVLQYMEEPVVSSDIIGNPHSSIYDVELTMDMGKRMFKVISWYDNEWGYSSRVVDLLEKMLG
jgi:glyceraldehyde 3-phosphate dehydrogenase